VLWMWLSIQRLEVVDLLGRIADAQEESIGEASGADTQGAYVERGCRKMFDSAQAKGLMQGLAIGDEGLGEAGTGQICLRHIGA
jgi:hypothetical protein